MWLPFVCVCFYLCFCFLLNHFYFYFFCLFCVSSYMATMPFAGYYCVVRCLLSTFPAFLRTCSGLIWFGSVYLVTTAEFVADQFM